MAQNFKKVYPLISIDEFLDRAKKVKTFTSSNGKRYDVRRIENDTMHFLRVEAESDDNDVMNLKNIYRAYQELDDFATINFEPYVAAKHSPARGLLLYLGLLK